MLTYETWDRKYVENAIKQMTDYMDVIKWAYREYGDKVVYACSFGAEGVVLIDLISKVNKTATVLFLDTGLHFKETYDVIEKIKKKYPSLNIEMVKPRISLEEQEKFYGNELWKDNPNLCCHLRKVVPLKERLAEAKAWISGLRREQSDARKHIDFINRDEKFQRIKICPIIYWTWEDVWNYIRLNDLPYNELHDYNYPSIGCETCTLPVNDLNNLRAGRWAGSEKTECGLHNLHEEKQ
ncbi:phosphoadenylyl-sulfate reductase [Anoxybacillus tepidamans]|uniref:phosphoadenylyl-sulfate reductase n=1 Tax=Anoxybacteroides tepidamans TaxID=265948 RepID=UPI0005581891|nr:phosphoadenylyl-sulfate reductase [Anoxybacillus tepidamans]